MFKTTGTGMPVRNNAKLEMIKKYGRKQKTIMVTGTGI
jgi:hypothetical protein